MSAVVISGDTSGSVTLQAPATAGSTTLTLPAVSGTVLQSGTTVTEAQGGTGTTVGYYGFKNRIINGAMTISQRGASPTITGGGDYSVDRFYNYYSGDAYTSVQSSTAPTGFINSLLLTVTTPSASPTYSFFGHKIEGLNCTDLGFGTASASTITISFWVRSSVTGVYSLAVGNSAGDRAYAVQYTINSANTWEQKTMTIAGDTSGTWLTTNGAGIVIRWNMGTSSAGRLISAGSWQAANADGATGSTGANTWANTSGATFYITGVQLEKGSTATSFDYRPYGTELALCQRYYQKISGSINGGNYQQFANMAYENASTAWGVIPLKTTMRAQPTTAYNGTFTLSYGVQGTLINDGNQTGGDIAVIGWTGGSGGAAGSSTYIRANASSAVFISFSAEL